MCYEYWSFRPMQSEEEEAKQRARELMEKARSAKPAPPASEPVSAEKENEAVPV